MYKCLIACTSVFILFITGCNSSDEKINDVEKYEIKQTIDETTQDDFIFRLVSDKAAYESGEDVKLYGEIEYIGDQAQISIFHSSSAIIFSMQEEVRGYDIGFGVNDIGLTTNLKKGEPYREEYTKSGGYSADDEEEFVEFMQGFLKNDDFPIGYYIVNGSTDFVVEPEEGLEERESIKIKATVDFKVVE